MHNMPMVADILHFCPDAKIDWVVEEAYTGLVGLNRGVRSVIPMALRRWRKSLLCAATRAEMAAFRRLLQSEAYDFVFDTQGLLKTAVVMRLARLTAKGKRIGLANGTKGSGYEGISRIFHDLSVPVRLHTPAVLRARTVAAKALGYVVDGLPDFGLQASFTNALACGPVPAWMPAGAYAVFFHATARVEKQWPVAHWIQLARSLNARGLPVLLPWGSEPEKRAAQQLQADIANAVVLPRLPLMEAVMLAQHAALVIGVDTGLTHIAAACNRPTIELYCDSPRWKTQGDWSPNIINLGDLGTPPDAAAVEAAANSLLDRIAIARDHG